MSLRRLTAYAQLRCGQCIWPGQLDAGAAARASLELSPGSFGQGDRAAPAGELDRAALGVSALAPAAGLDECGTQVGERVGQLQLCRAWLEDRDRLLQQSQALLLIGHPSRCA